jgi:hypothetical protein
MAALTEMLAKARAANKIGNTTLAMDARAAGFNPDDETSSEAFLDHMAGTVIATLKSWDGRRVTAAEAKANPQHPMVKARDALTWLIAIGATKQADAIKAMAAEIAAAHS